MSEDFVQDILGACKQRNGRKAAQLLMLQGYSKKQRKVFFSAIDPGSFRKACKSNFPKFFSSMICNHILSQFDLCKKQIDQAYENQLQALTDAVQWCAGHKEEAWFLPIINAVLTQSRVATGAAEAASARQDQQKWQKCVEQVRQLVRTFQVSSRKQIYETLQYGLFFVVNHLFKIYFKMNQISAIPMTMRPLKRFETQLTMFPKKDTVTYRFLVGKYQVINEQYREAEQSLEYAFKHCHKDHVANKRRILQLLIPLRLLTGRFPSPRLQKKYPLPQLQPVIQAVGQGSIKQFREHMTNNEQAYIDSGIYLMLEKLEPQTYRNLCQRVYKVMQKMEKEGKVKKAQILKLAKLQAALKIQHVTMDNDELECILANLIFKGFMKGYIAHGRAVVLAKANPFPKMSIK